MYITLSQNIVRILHLERRFEKLTGYIIAVKLLITYLTIDRIKAKMKFNAFRIKYKAILLIVDHSYIE